MACHERQVFILLLTLGFFCSGLCEMWQEQDRLSAESWRATESWVKEWVQGVTFKLEPVLKQVDQNLSTKCKDQAWQIIRGLHTMNPSAVKMIDSWSKLPPGFTSGVASFFGDFDGCLSLNSKPGSIPGQYCNIQTVQRVPRVSKVHLLTVNSRFPEFAETAMTNNTVLQTYVRERLVWYYRYGYKFGVCLPVSCTMNDVTIMAKEALKELRWEVRITDCQRKEETKISLLQICILTCFSVLFVVIAISTVLNFARRGGNEDQGHVLHFSLLHNWRNLTSSPKSGSRFSFLDGYKAVVVHWTILLHTFSMYEPSVLSGCFSAVTMIKIPVFQLIMNAWVSVDTSFCIAGFLLGYSLLRSLDENDGKINWTKLILKRICRMSPLIWTVLGMIFLAPIIGGGPHWHQNFQLDIEKCKSSWWPVVLFLNNRIDYEKMCLPQTWYASCDLQLYILGLIFTYVLYKSQNLGIKAFMSAIVLSSLWLARVVYVNDLHPTMIWETFDERFRDKMLDLTYLGVLPHLPATLIGILVSYILHTAPKIRLGTVSVYLGWAVSASVMFWVLMIAYPWHNGDWPSTSNAALYQGTHKVLWSLANAWIIYACLSGHGGLAQRLLSWTGFSTLGKLSFVMNMINIPVIRFKNAILRRYINFGLVDLYYDFLGHYVICFAIGTFLYLTVEAPFASLTESFFREKKKDDKKKQ